MTTERSDAENEAGRKIARIILEVWTTKDYDEQDIRRDLRRFFAARGAYTRLIGHTFTSAVEFVPEAQQ